jgi:hypothetical protein
MDFVSILNTSGEMLPTTRYKDLELMKKYKVLNFEKTLTKFGQTIICFFTNDQGERAKVFLPKRFAVTMTQEKIDSFNSTEEDLYMVYKGMEKRAHDVVFEK